MVLLGQHSAKEHLFKMVNTGDSTHKGYQTRLWLVLCVCVGQDNDEHLVSVVNAGDVIHRGY